MRVSHGECKQCRAPVVYLGAECCSPKCYGLMYGERLCVLCRQPIFLTQKKQICGPCSKKLRMESDPFKLVPPVPLEQVLVLDTETKKSEPGCQVPPLACVSWADHRDFGLLHHTEAWVVEQALRSDRLLVGHQISYDMAIFCEALPHLRPLIFKAYEDNRITDTLLREKLIDIAEGTRQFGESGFRKYSLDAVAQRRLGIHLVKEGGWRLRFGELIPYPLEMWPEEAKSYAVSDAVVTFGVYRDQEKSQQWLHDQYRQARAAFWIELMSAWGLHTDPEAVRLFAAKIQREYDAIAEDLIAAGLMRRKHTRKKATGLVEVELVRNVKVVRDLVEKAYKEIGKEPDRTATYLVKTDADTCERSKDPLLKKYAELSSLSTTLSTYIPLLEQGVHTPIHAYFDTLLVTGRTSSSPNVQNLPTEVGVRECFVARAGSVFAIGDYSGMELRTWSQICIDLQFGSEMARYLNEGLDPHLKMASLILKISYEEAAAEFEREPTGRVYKARQSGKVANFGFPGGLGYKRFVEYARINYGVILDPDPDEALNKARDLKEFWQTAWPESQKYADWVARQCEADEVRLEQDFVRRYRGGVSYTEYSNGLFQGLAADAAKNAGFLISKACYIDNSSPLFGGHIADFIHDEFPVEVRDDARAHDAAIELGHLMEEGAKPFLPDVPPKVEPYLARRFSKKAKPVHGPDGRLIPWDMSLQR